MNILKQILGVALISLAWFDPLGVNMSFRILLFILGFDLMSLLPKLVIFILDYVFELSTLGWSLLLLICVETMLELLKLKPLVNLIIKPLVVFLIVYMNNLSLEFSVIIAGIDLLLNLTKKYV